MSKLLLILLTITNLLERLLDGMVRLGNPEKTSEGYSRPVIHLAARMVPMSGAHMGASPISQNGYYMPE